MTALKNTLLLLAMALSRVSADCGCPEGWYCSQVPDGLGGTTGQLMCLKVPDPNFKRDVGARTPEEAAPALCFSGNDNDCPAGQVCDNQLPISGFVAGARMYECVDETVKRDTEAQAAECSWNDRSCPDGQKCTDVTPIGWAGLPIMECQELSSKKRDVTQYDCNPDGDDCPEGHYCSANVSPAMVAALNYSCIPGTKRDLSLQARGQPCDTPMGGEECPEGQSCVSVGPSWWAAAPTYECI